MSQAKGKRQSMLRQIAISLIATLLLALVPVSARVIAQPGTQTMTYMPSDENFPNPERGFYIQRSPLWIDEERIPLEREELDQARAQGIDLIRTYYVLDRHRDRMLDDSVFAALQADLDTIRAAGFKVILRFTYNFPLDESCVRAIDAPLEIVLMHIDQLAPILRANVDVIAHMEAGFIGAWGEWHSSSNQLIDHPLFGINEPGREILFRLLDAPIALDLYAALPPDLPAGTYMLLLALPDPEPALADDPRYAIRLTNADLWDEATGYHDLGLTVNVGSSS